MLLLLVFSICFSSDIIELDGIKEKRYTVYDQASLNTCAPNAVAGALSLLDPTLLPDIHYINHYAKVCYGMVHGNMNEIDFDFGSSLISVICGVKYCGISNGTYLKNLIYEKVLPGSDFIKALKKVCQLLRVLKLMVILQEWNKMDSFNIQAILTKNYIMKNLHQKDYTQ